MADHRARRPRSGSTASSAWRSSTPTRRAAAADRQRGAVLGRCRHRHGHHGHVAGRRGDLRPGHRRADRRVDPAVLRHASRSPKVAAFCASRARRRLRRLGHPHHRALRRGDRRVGPQRPEGVGHQRRHRRRPRGDRLGRPRAGLARPRRVRRLRPGPRASSRARRSRSTGCAPGTPPTCTSTTAASRPTTCSAARRSSTSAWPACARAARARAGGDGDVRGLAPDRRRAGAGHRPRRLRVRAASTPRSASSSAARSSRTRRSPSRWPT